MAMPKYRRPSLLSVVLLTVLTHICSTILLTLRSKKAIDDFGFAMEEISPAHTNQQQSSYIDFEVPSDRNIDKEELLFVPGSLNLTRLESFKHCYFNPDQYQQHYSKKYMHDISIRHKLLYVMIPKAGSSTARHLMHTFFNDSMHMGFGKKTFAKNQINRYYSFTFTRDPLTRFISSFREFLVKVKRDPTKLSKQPKFAKMFLSLPEKKRKKVMYKDVNSTARLLELFVDEYDGINVPDGHLRLQVPMLKASERQEGRIFELDAIHDVHNIREEFIKLWVANAANGDTSTPPLLGPDLHQKIHLDVSSINIETQKKICELSALDFCCLNYPLPTECEGVLSCKWVKHPNQTNKSSLSPMVITAVSPYPPLN